MTLHSEHVFMKWLLRIVGFLMMWFGLSMFFGPISTFLDVIPIFGTVSRGLIGVILFFVTLPLAIITILVSVLVHNLIVLAVVVVAVLIITMALLFRKKEKPKTA
jgi:hypothetical protein